MGKCAFFLASFFVYLKMYLNIPVQPYIPLLVLFMKKPLAQVLWIGFFCGTILDLLSSTPFGLFALLYTLLALFLSFFQKYFDGQKAMIYLILVILASSTFSLIHLLSLFFIEKNLEITAAALITDVVIFGIFDSFFGLCMIYIPFYLFEKSKKWPIKKIILKKIKSII